MIRSTYEYVHSVWKQRTGQYSFCGIPVNDMTEDELRAALAFMVQYAGDTQTRLFQAQEATA